ncbi:MAG: ABC transporter ATP-binding protein [Lachnospiraceae bacterium]|nr:ABC transporter ATP-binding protein [Lachnospiraceae bacterium]
MLEVKNLQFHYPKQPLILDRINFRIEEKDCVCLLGPNGTGKTSLLKCLLALHKPTGGQILINGADIAHLSAGKRAAYMAYVPQASEFAFSYSAEEVVIMGRIAHLKPGMNPGRKDLEICRQVMKRLGIFHLARKQFNKMSGGEKQMFLVARAMAQEARILIMDEPTANLDYGNQVQMLKIIRQLSEEGYSILMTSHYPDHALRICNRVLLLKDGGIQKEGKPEEVLTTGTLTELYGTQVWVSEAMIEEIQQKTRVCIPDIHIQKEEPVQS